MANRTGVTLTVLLMAASWHTAVVAEEKIEFARDIQPILAQRCILCHGPDDAEAGLRLHLRESATAELESGSTAIVPAKPDASDLLARVASDDPDVRMPPEGEPLTADEIAKLRRWIAEGANWEVHWAYRPLADSPPPAVKNEAAVRNDIDRFVVAALESKEIAPSPAADRTTLIKRLYYDLLGLPPQPGEVDAFVNDKSPDAYEKLVDRLLDSPHFGERWGRHWLDKARYADSDGYEKDNHRADAWRYRDWVIAAINDDMPYDQFTIEQLAGDMLPGATPLQKLATAFNRQTLTNTEGGTDKEQWRVAAVMDRTETLGTVWLGLTVGCARCHTHKYDQITQREYYQLFAYFNNGDEVNASVPKASPIDESSRTKLSELKTALDKRAADLEASYDNWLPKLRAEAAASDGGKVAYHPLQDVKISGPGGVNFTAQSDGSYLVSGANPATAKYTIEATTTAKGVTGIHLDVLADPKLPAKGPGRVKHGNFVLNEVRLYAASGPKWADGDRQQFAAATADFSQDQWPVANAIDGIEGAGREGTGWAVAPQFGQNHKATFALAQPLADGKQHLQVVLSQTYGTQHTIGRFRLLAVTGPLPGAGLPEDVRKLLAVDKLDDNGKARLVSFYQARDQQSQQIKDEIARLTNVSGEMMNVRVIGHRGSSPRKTHILRRGEFKQPLDPVATDTLTTLPPIRPREGQTATDRLDLARWLVDGDNPLPPRVAVNHVWKHLFGRGLTPTMNDFGVRGDPPTHPELLDHLATTLIDKGWSRKALIKYIVISATYRQSSKHRPEFVDIDPTNSLLHRQNRFRVEAEIIRDITLSASGLLSRKVGGPSVFPPIPKSVTDLTYNSSFKWNTSSGEDRYRRGMYTYFKRTAPHPNLITFDCPDSNVTNVQRDRSNTPIGALVTLNNETFVEAAQAMAKHVLSQETLNDDRARLTYALRSCIARAPTDAEVDDFAKLLETSRGWYAKHPADAKQLIGGHTVTKVPPPENAAWVATLRMVLNLDEFITRE